jgi:catechol 2,3-dioxygenase-like lactoylglutathione lyase family enzyme
MDVEVRNIRWIGVPTENYAAMREFLARVMGLRVNFEEPTTVELETTEGDEIQLMAPGDPYFDFFREHARGPVPLFEVDDVHAARADLEAAGIAIIGEIGRDSRWEWIHFRAPDGNLYELASRLSS